MRTLILFCLALVVSACNDGGGPEGDADILPDTDLDGPADADGDIAADAPPPPEGCNPLAAEWDCLLPYPSDFYLTGDSSAPGDRRIDHPGPGLPLADEQGVDLVDPRPADGFTRTPIILALFPMGVDERDLVFHTDDVSRSTTDDSPTLLIDAVSGERVAHFAELDPRAEHDHRRALIIHPLTPLDFQTRYLVAIRGLRDRTGAEISAPSGFARLRDREAATEPLVMPLEAHYEEDIFPALEASGVDRDELQLAWDFTTGSRENRTHDMLRVRELVMAACEASPPQIVIGADGVEDDVDEHIARRIRGVIEVPLYVENTAPGAQLHRDDAGEVAQNGVADADFLLLIPRSVTQGIPGRIVQFGHGFFGTRDELDNEFGHAFADQTGSVMVAIDWWGMSAQDMIPISNDIAVDFAQLPRFTERVHQAMANQIALTYTIGSTMAALPELQVDGELVYEPEELYYYGISNGHILGGTYVALAPNVSRAALSSGGINYSLMMFRSASFGGFLFMMNMVMSDPLDLQKAASMVQLPLDRIDPTTYASFVLDELLPGGPSERHILLHSGVGDPKVPNLCTHMQVRTLDIPQVGPAPRPIFGVETAEAPIDGSAFVEFDFNEPDPLPGTYGDTPEEDNGVHDRVRRLQASIQQIDAFFEHDGLVESFCDGACDPE